MGAHAVGPFLRRISVFLMTAVFYIPGAILVPLPGRWRLALGRGIGNLFRVLRFRERVIQQNLEIAYPGVQSEPERKKIFDRAYEHLGQLVLELFLLPGPFCRFIRSFAELRGLEHWKCVVESGRPAIFLSSHVGNWEIMAASGAQGGIPLMIVTKHLKPEPLHRVIEAARARCGVSGAYEPKTLRDVMSHLQKGGTVGFVLDQYAGPPVGVRVPFFGVPVGTAMIVATLARRLNAGVLPVMNRRLPDGTYVTEIRSELPWIPDPDPTRELAVNTAAYAARIEADVRSTPDQWLWTHRRFKGDLSPLRPGEWESGRRRDA